MFFCNETGDEEDPGSFKLFDSDALLGAGRCASSGRNSPATEAIEQQNLSHAVGTTNHYHHVQLQQGTDATLTHFYHSVFLIVNLSYI